MNFLSRCAANAQFILNGEHNVLLPVVHVHLEITNGQTPPQPVDFLTTPSGLKDAIETLTAVYAAAEKALVNKPNFITEDEWIKQQQAEFAARRAEAQKELEPLLKAAESKREAEGFMSEEEVAASLAQIDDKIVRFSPTSES